MRGSLLLAALSILLTAPVASAQWEPSDGGGDRRQKAKPAKKGDQVLPTFALRFSERARFELLPRPNLLPPAEDAARDWRVANRVRSSISLDIEIPDGTLTGFFELQDARSWGSPASPLEGGTYTWAAEPGLTVRKAYAALRHEEGPYLVLGRQAVPWMSRLVGENDWGNGRTFDAIRVGFQQREGLFEGFYSKRLEAPVDASLDPRGPAEDMHLIGVRGGPRATGLVLDALLLVEVDGTEASKGAIASVGAYGGGLLNNTFWYSVELYGQVGNRGEEEHRAFLIGAVLGAQIPIGDWAAAILLKGGLETISGRGAGDTDLDTFLIRQGDTFGHYGRMNRYLDTVVGTLDQGLVDVSFRLDVLPDLELDLDIGIEAHLFRAQNPVDDDAALHGGEFDLNFRYAPLWNVAILAEAWVYVPGPFWGPDRAPDFGMLAGLEVKIR